MAWGNSKKWEPLDLERFEDGCARDRKNGVFGIRARGCSGHPPWVPPNAAPASASTTAILLDTAKVVSAAGQRVHYVGAELPENTVTVDFDLPPLE